MTPTGLILMVNESISLCTIRSFHRFPVPLKLFVAHAMAHDAKQRTLRQRPRIAEITRRFAAVLARLDPFGVMTDGIGDRRRRRLEALELILRHQHVAAVVGKQIPLFSHKQHPAAPLAFLRVLKRVAGLAL